MNTNQAINNIQTIGVNNLHTIINNFMEFKKKDSIKTYEAYLRYYNEFFNYTCNKNLYDLTWDDLATITNDTVEAYQLFMLNEKGWAKSTCNQKLFAVKKLWDRLLQKDKNDVLDYKALKFNKLELEDSSYASLTTEEVDLLIDFAKEQQYKGDIQSMIFEFLYTIGCRKNTPFILKKSDITKNYDFQAEKYCWVVNYDEKGKKKITKAISDEFYNKITDLYEDDTDRVFNICSKKVEQTFDAFKEKYNLYKKNGKKVVIHSIKKTSGWSVYKITGDLNKTKEHMQHEHMDTTVNIYANGKDNYSSQGSYLLSKKVGIEDLSNTSKEDLLNALGKCGKDIINRVYYELQNKQN